MKTFFMFAILGCSVAVDDYYAFKEHTFTCDNARNTPSPTCVHCRRSFVKNDKFFDHINLHGVPRYWCSLCDFKYTSVPRVSDHMKTHKVLKTKVVPADNLKTNQFCDIFFVIPDLVSYFRSYSYNLAFDSLSGYIVLGVTRTIFRLIYYEKVNLGTKF